MDIGLGGATGFISRATQRYPQLAICEGAMRAALAAFQRAWDADGRLLVCGNGGSAADADHVVGELLKGFLLPRPLPAGDARRLSAGGIADGPVLAATLQRGLPALALTTHAAFLTAWGNDVDNDLVFAQQVYVQGRPRDCLLAISTSGNSRNVVLAAETARALGMGVVGLTGSGGGHLATYCDVCVQAPAEATSDVQELHLVIYHALCAEAEAHYFGQPDRDGSR